MLCEPGVLCFSFYIFIIGLEIVAMWLIKNGIMGVKEMKWMEG